jgi:hypothetical protein
MKFMQFLPMGIDLNALSAGGAPLAALVSQRALPDGMLNPNGSSNNHYAGGGQPVSEADTGEGPLLAKNAKEDEKKEDKEECGCKEKDCDCDKKKEDKKKEDKK